MLAEIVDRVVEDSLKNQVDTLDRCWREVFGELGVPELVEKPWGKYVDHFRSRDVVFKLLYVNPGQQLSRQLHYKRVEHWYCLAGKGRAIVEGVFTITHHLEKGSQVHIPQAVIHRLVNDSTDQLIIAEMQMGDCEENDIVRLEDMYGRK